MRAPVVSPYASAISSHSTVQRARRAVIVKHKLARFLDSHTSAKHVRTVESTISATREAAAPHTRAISPAYSECSALLTRREAAVHEQVESLGIKPHNRGRPHR
jgi:hypothetical protein